MIKRILQDVIEQRFFKGKVIVLLGPRQVGKTTLMEQIRQSPLLAGMQVVMLNCDEPDDRQALTNANSADLAMLVGGAKVLIIDEAQRVQNIGLTVKLLADRLKDLQIIVTGSSSLDLANKLNEPLTGRKYEYLLLPVSTQEIIAQNGMPEAIRMLESRLIYGSYPDIIFRKDDVRELLMQLTNSYLFKDIYAMQDVRKPDLLEKLLVALALQIGNEVSFNELAQTIHSDVKTVERYISLLEQTFVIFRLSGLNRNLRNELKKAKKFYFYDNGVRNAVLQLFSPLNLRQDAGALWENFFMSERLKYNKYNLNFVKSYFWRTQTQQEIDLVEESDGVFRAYELKWNTKRRATFPESFVNMYKPAENHIITPENYIQFLI
ncbi:MAG: ATP-binding protein [Tannerella sp.]|jgi:predicted AAA+ superfamily ATPase|nr:ATP-binding protein [Tannerella sp.]